MVAVSVIVPIHNSKKYIKECMESIIQQTLKAIEIICVDSSIDGTTSILYDYQNIDSRIIIIEDENSSYGYKLNRGIKSAVGEYIAIVESDDYIAEDMMEKLYYAAGNHKLDVIKANFTGFMDTDSGRIFAPYSRQDKSLYNRIISLQKEEWVKPLIDYNIWAGIYRKEFLIEKEIRVHESEGASYQDVGFADLAAMQAENIYFIEDYLYKYRMDNEGSSVKSNRKYRCIPLEFAWLSDQIKKRKIATKTNVTFFKITRLNAYYWNYQRLSGEYRKKFLEEISGENLGDFDEEVLRYDMPNKEHLLELFKGNTYYLEIEENRENYRVMLYKKLISLFKNYNKIVLVCYGAYGQAVYQLMKLAGYKSIHSICDNFIEGKELYVDGIEITNIEEAVNQNLDSFFIVCNKKYGTDIKYQIIRLGVEEKNIYVCDDIGIGLELFEDFNRYC